MAVSNERINELAMLKVGRSPAWTSGGPFSAATKPPESSADMVSLDLARAFGNAVRCHVEMLLRENAAKRTARAEIFDFDLTTDYTVTIDGNAHTENGTTDEESTIDLLVTNINAGRTGSGPETESGRSKVVLGTIDGATTYTITLDSFDHEVVGDTDKATTAAAMLVVLEASPLTSKFSFSVDGNDDIVIDNLSGDTYTVDVAVTGGTGTISFVLIPVVASREGSGSSSVLLLEGTGSPDYTVALSEATGSGRWAPLQADATDVDVTIWGLHSGRTVPVALQGHAYTMLTENQAISIDVAGLSHLLPVITDTDGLVQWAAGPADLES